ncbi:MAG: hypothetical protein JXR07_14175 [Reichenbachiella sp.]
MITTYLIGIFGIVGLMIAWVGIQSVWKRIFAEHVTDEDAMAGRTKCSNCGCTTACKNKKLISVKQ